MTYRIRSRYVGFVRYFDGYLDGKHVVTSMYRMDVLEALLRRATRQL